MLYSPNHFYKLIFSFIFFLLVSSCTNENFLTNEFIIVKSQEPSILSYFGATDIYAVNSNNGEKTTYSSPTNLKASKPVWSPDGKWIAFSDQENWLNATQTRIFIMPAKGGKKIQVTFGNDIRGRNPNWFPDGKTLLFKGSKGIYTIDVSCVIEKRNCDDLKPEFIIKGQNPNLSPDGYKFIFSTYDENMNKRLMLYNFLDSTFKCNFDGQKR